MTEIEVILADDHPLLRRGVKELLEAERKFHVVAEAGDGEKALELAKQYPGAILIIDLMMPKMDGFKVMEEIQKNSLSNRVIILTMHNNENIFNRAMDLGAIGYVIKDSTDMEIIDAVNAVSLGQYYVSPSITGFLVNRSGYGSFNKANVPGILTLTSAERKILKMISENKSTKDIANSLFISIHTVERHRANICKKLDLHGTNALLRFILDNQDML